MSYKRTIYTLPIILHLLIFGLLLWAFFDDAPFYSSYVIVVIISFVLLYNVLVSFVGFCIVSMEVPYPILWTSRITLFFALVALIFASIFNVSFRYGLGLVSKVVALVIILAYVVIYVSVYAFMFYMLEYNKKQDSTAQYSSISNMGQKTEIELQDMNNTLEMPSPPQIVTKTKKDPIESILFGKHS